MSLFASVRVAFETTWQALRLTCKCYLCAPQQLLSLKHYARFSCKVYRERRSVLFVTYLQTRPHQK